MSKTSKAKAKLIRLSKKRAKKAEERAKYAKYRDMGINKKTARNRRRSKAGRKVGRPYHPEPVCGNIGCKLCSPLYQPGGALYGGA